MADVKVKRTGTGAWEVFTGNPDDTFTLPTWRESYDIAYTLARVRNVVLDVIATMPNTDIWDDAEEMWAVS